MRRVYKGLYHTKLDDGYCMAAGRGGKIEHGTKMRLFRCEDNKHQRFVGPDGGLGTIKLKDGEYDDLCVEFRGINPNINVDPIIMKRCNVAVAGWSQDSPAEKCSLDCPCCNEAEWPEFVAAVERYTGRDSCFVRSDDNLSQIIALDLCETSTLAGFESGITGYMSYDYENRGGTPDEPVYYCGDSSSSVNFVTQIEGAACEALIQSRVDEEDGLCNNVFECV